ncbi:MAG: response regulator [Lachnospiraceae bacterium]|nr:response regulator [Lachnospiraceae bacterium]
MSVSRTRGDGQNERVVMGFRDVTASTLEVQRDLKERMETEMELEREKRANEIKSEFLFNVSHDIRTPMNAILGFASLARKHADRADRLDEYLGMVEDSGHQLLELINDLLDMSTLESGQLEFKTAPSDPAEQIAKVLELFEPDASKKNLRIVREIDLPYDELVLLDAQRFRRVIGNLVSNAVKFTPEGGHIKVSAHRMKHTESGYSRYQFAITDTGIGISDEYIKHIFNPFVREQSSTESGNTGTGLGLSIAKNLVDIMGGTLFVESKKGEGTTFTLELPLKHATDAKTESAPPAPAGDAAHTDGEYRILLVEDIELNRLLAETVLKESGFLVESVVDGCDAVDAVRDHPLWYYDLILMDIQMPVMNGYEATRAIRAVHRADIQSLPIVALSANAGEQDRQKSLDSGMNDHIAKPFNVTQLISTIRDHIESRATQVE